jgi:hypothetical protein
MTSLNTLTIIVFAQLFLLRGCDITNSPIKPISRPPEKIYFNSFETERDTIGIRGYGFIGLRNDAPDIGGRKSLLVSGGCLIPHAYIELPAVNYDRSVMLRCWGKNLAVGGEVILSNNKIDSTGFPNKSVSISVQDTVWRFYKSDVLQCPAGTPLTLTMNSGGCILSIMLVDLLEVIMVE